MTGGATPAGPVPAWLRLRVADGARARAFYGGVLGLEVEEAKGEMRVGPPGAPEPVLLVEVDPDAPAAPARSAGLFHLALKVPGRSDLARVLRRLGDRGYPVAGLSDHAVSEAVYLSDPEGNGVEVYADRPRGEWRWSDGEIAMTTRPLDVADLLAEAGEQAGVPEGTTLGHLHLRTADLEAAEAFWTSEVGLEVTTRGYPGALFLASGGYHHHLGLNSWGGPLERPVAGALGLVETAWRVSRSGGGELRDPDGLRVTLVAS